MHARRLFPIMLVVGGFALAGAAHAQTDDTYEVTIDLHEFEGGGMHLAPEQYNVPQGAEVRFIVSNPANNSIAHDLVVCAEPPDQDPACAPENVWGRTPLIPPGETRTLTFTASEAGRFEYYCQVVGHKTAAPGMKGTLLVQSSGSDTNESPSLAALGSVIALAGVALALRRR